MSRFLDGSWLCACKGPREDSHNIEIVSEAVVKDVAEEAVQDRDPDSIKDAAEATIQERNPDSSKVLLGNLEKEPVADALTLPIKSSSRSILLKQAPRSASYDSVGSTASNMSFLAPLASDLVGMDPDAGSPGFASGRGRHTSGSSGSGGNTPASLASGPSPTNSIYAILTPSTRLGAELARRRRSSVDRIRGVASSVSHRIAVLRRHHKAMREDAPKLAVPTGKALSSSRIDGMTLAQLETLVQGTNGGCFSKFMTQAMSCQDFSCVAWSSHPSGAQAGSMSFTVPRPKEVPDAVRKVITIPASIVGFSSTWYRYNEQKDEIVLLFRVKFEGISNSDRFHIDYTYTFKQKDGGLNTSIWADVIWLKPLPWTHSFLGRMLEKRVKAETNTRFQTFINIVKESSSSSSAVSAAVSAAVGGA